MIPNQDALKLLEILARSENDFEAGRTISQDEAFARAAAAIRDIERKNQDAKS